MGGNSNESAEQQAARAGQMAGFGFGGFRRKYTVGGCLGLRTVIGLLICIALIIVFTSLTKGIPLLPPKKAASIELSVKDFAASGRLTIEQGQISYAGASVLFVGQSNAYQTATKLVDPVDGVRLLNGSFAARGKTWCVAVKTGDVVTVTTDAGIQPRAVMCGPLGRPVLTTK